MYIKHKIEERNIDRLDTTKFDSIITRVAVLTVQLLVPNTNIRPVETISQLNMANATLETVDVIKQSQ